MVNISISFHDSSLRHLEHFHGTLVKIQLSLVMFQYHRHKEMYDANGIGQFRYNATKIIFGAL